AWLPGSEGAGVADVLLRGADGKAQHDFKGKLSVSWPRRADQYDNNVGQPGYDPLFAFGHGLTYNDDGNLAALPAESGIDPDAAGSQAWFDKGVATTGLTLRLVGADGNAMDIVHPAATTTDGSLAMVAINHEVQEGARQFSWQGDAALELRSNAPIDLGRETNGDANVVVTLRVDALPAGGNAAATATCGEDCSGTVAIGTALAALPRGEWTTLAIPLKCLRDAGAATATLDMPVPFPAGAGPPPGAA